MAGGRAREAPPAAVTATEETARTTPVEVPAATAVADAVGKAEVRVEVIVRPPRRPERERQRFRTSEPPAGLDPRIQSGTLTAGSFDDVLHFDDYRRFVAMAVSHDPRESPPRLAIERRAMIEVVTAQGMPVGGARVTVHAADQRQRGPVLTTLMTGSDGRAMFLPEMDAGEDAAEYVVVAEHDGVAQERFVQRDQEPWRVELPDAQAELPRRLDLALVVDTTGSMSDELEYLKVEIDSIAQTIYRIFPEVDQRYALVVYRDEGDEYVVRPFDFTASLAEFRDRLADQSARGGGDEPEAVHLAMEQAVGLDWREGNTARVLFHVADAPPHVADRTRTLAAVNQLRSRGVRLFPVASSGVGIHAEMTMRASAFLALGQYLFLTDHSGVGNPHAAPHVAQYAVERLDRLMFRMIVSELAGRRMAPEEVVAVESGRYVEPGPLVERLRQEARQMPSVAHPLPASTRAESAGWMPHPWLVLAALVCGAFLVDSMNRSRCGP